MNKSPHMALSASLTCALMAWAPSFATTLHSGESMALPSGSTWAAVGLSGGQANMVISDGDLVPGNANQTLGGYVGLMNLMRVSTSAEGYATVFEDMGPDQDPYRQGVAVQNTVNSMGVNAETGALQSIGTTGGTLWSAPFQLSVVKGGTFQMTNWRFDLDAKTVTADLYGVRQPYTTPTGVLQDGAVYDLPETVAWTFDSVTGVRDLSHLSPGALPDGVREVSIDGQNYLALTHRFANLHLTAVGDATLRGGFGPFTIGGYVFNDALAGAEGFGTVTTTTYLSLPDVAGAAVPTLAPVPEPSTYALMGLGLVGIAVVARRRQRTVA